jgi:acyl-CoA dehydrogenase
MPLAETLEETLSWPFFEAHHRAFAEELARWAGATLPGLPHDDVDAACRARVAALGQAGFFRAVVPAEHGGLHDKLDVRTICLAREILGFHDGLADFAMAMQGLGTGSISLYGTPELKARYLPPVRDGKAIAAFALSEPEAGSDVAAMATTASPDGNSHVRIDGLKTWISNGGIADHYLVFARTGEGPGAKGLSAFMVDADTPGLSIAERIDVIAPHPLATLKFDACRVPVSQRLGAAGEGFKVAMATLDIFRSTVGAAALGFARRALHETMQHTATRKLFGAPLGELQLTQGAIADSATEVDAAALLVYRSAWTKDVGPTGLGAARVTREAAMAKMYATEAAQQVIDRAVQLHGGRGVTKGEKVEELYREIRALRIYEGATEVQKVVIAREAMKNAAKPAPAAE